MLNVFRCESCPANGTWPAPQLSRWKASLRLILQPSLASVLAVPQSMTYVYVSIDTNVDIFSKLNRGPQNHSGTSLRRYYSPSFHNRVIRLLRSSSSVVRISRKKNFAQMIMGRLSRSTPSVGVNYRKLVDEISGSCDSLKIMPGLPDFFFYSCRHCGHRQKLQVINVSTTFLSKNRLYIEHN